MNFSIRTLLMISAMTLAGCTVGPDYQQPGGSVLDTWFASENSQKQSSTDPVIIEWWGVFNDPMLNKYIEQAVRNNKDVQIATANVRRARALRQQSASSLFPQVDAQGDAARSKGSDNLSATGNADANSFFDAGFDASWEIDIFGGNRRGVEAAEARVGSAIANHQDVMLTVLSEVARNYYEARGLQKRIAITEENAGLFKKTADLIETRLEAGESSEFDLSRAQGQYQLTRARVPNLNAELQASVFNLSVLLGQPPEYLLEDMKLTKPLPAPPDVVPVGLRSELLRRRPDVRVAERELAAATADIGVATSDLFPKFFLTGSAGSEADAFGDLFRAGGGFWSFGSLVQWPVFSGGSIRAQIATEEAETQAALATYEKTVLEALRDTETALTRYGEELETRRRLELGVGSRRKSVSLAQELFRAGEQDFLAVLDSERELVTSEDDLVVSETQSITKLIALYTALGGGWEAFPPEGLEKPAPAEAPPAEAKAEEKSD
jgi:NodT family efflux transporter outer membrane factor (OMF) lipoprotein